MTANIKDMKIVFFGDSSVGKTALVKRWVHNQYDDNWVPTVGAEVNSKRIEGIRYHCWDTSGPKKYQALMRTYLKRASICLLVFDVGNRVSYDSLIAQIDEVKKDCPEITKFILVGNKCDTKQANRQVTAEEARAYAAKRQMEYCEVSPLTGVGVDAFEQQIVSLCQPIVKQIAEARKAALLQKINNFAQSRPNNHHVQQITRILIGGLNTADPRAYYEQNTDELIENYQALRWTSKSLLNSALNVILFVFAKFGFNFSLILANNQVERGHHHMFYAFGAHQEAQVLQHEITKYLAPMLVAR